MRTLHSNLTAAQRSDSDSPYVRLDFVDFEAATASKKTYATDDATQRIISVEAAEGTYGSRLFSVTGPGGRPLPISARIIFDNSDQHFGSLDMRGWKVDIGWGFDIASGDKYSEGEPFWVIKQVDISVNGAARTELWCISAWFRLNIAVQTTGGDALPYKSNKIDTARNLLQDVFTSYVTKAFADDDGAFSDYTAALSNNTDTDVTPLPATPEATNDKFYIGSSGEFDHITIETTVAMVLGTATCSIQWQYYGTGAWRALDTDFLVDNINKFQTVGLKTVSFRKPTDWADTTINGVALRYIRFQVISASGTPSTRAQIARIGVGNHWGLEVGTTDGIEDVLAPDVETTAQSPKIDLVRNIVNRLQSSLIMKKNGFVLSQYVLAPTSTVYDFDLDGTHTLYETNRERMLVYPNKVTYVERPSGNEKYSGSDTNSTSINELGTLEGIFIDETIASDANAATQATRHLNNLEEDLHQGYVRVPMECGLEPWDWIGVTDDRNSVTFEGRIGKIVRRFIPAEGTYEAEINLGNIEATPVPLIATDLGRNYAGAGTTTLNREGIELQGGVGTATGGVTLVFTARSNIAANDAVYLENANGVRNDPDTEAKQGQVIGIALDTVSTNDSVRVRVLGMATAVAGDTINFGDRVIMQIGGTAGRVINDNSHIHSVSGSTGTESATHQHSGTGSTGSTSGHNHTHNHSLDEGLTGNNNRTHTHDDGSYATVNSGNHDHDVTSGNTATSSGGAGHNHAYGTLGTGTEAAHNHATSGDSGTNDVTHTHGFGSLASDDDSSGESGHTHGSGAVGNASATHTHGSIPNVNSYPSGRILGKANGAASAGGTFSLIILHGA